MVRLLYISSEFYLAHGGVQTGFFFFSEGLFIFFFFYFFCCKDKHVFVFSEPEQKIAVHNIFAEQFGLNFLK